MSYKRKENYEASMLGISVSGALVIVIVLGVLIDKFLI